MTTNKIIGQRCHRAEIRRGLFVEFWWTGYRMECRWDPDVPKRPLKGHELERYRAARHGFMTELVEVVGGKVLVVEV